MTQVIDDGKVEEFAGRVMEIVTGGMLSHMLHIGHSTGLLDAAAEGPATSAELAERAGLEERYVREWLAACTTGGITTYDPATGVFSLPPEHALLLCGNSAMNLAVLSLLVTHLGKHVEDVAASFRAGGGVPYERYRPEFTEVMDILSRRTYDEVLLSGHMAAVPQVQARLEAGTHVADIGCGTGHALNLLAQAFPASEFTGYDLAADAIERARAEAAAMKLTNARFEVRDVATLPTDPRFGVITAFDAIHDQVDPAGVLARIEAALADDGAFVMIDIKGTSRIEEDMANPTAPFAYSVSVLHCMTVSLAHGGAGLGTMWGERTARQMLAAAGFGRVSVHDVEGDPFNSLYECWKA